ncbi:MAG: hypothetical protein OEM62_02310 [Acidobacteriota bacterium]|nr:hypothetical protein [Acidobacteriota bacterium]
MSAHGWRPLCVFAVLLAITAATPIVAGSEKKASQPTLLTLLELWTAQDTKAEAAHALLRRVTLRPDTNVGFPASSRKDWRLIRRLANDEPEIYVPAIGLYREAHLLAVRLRDSRAEEALRLASIHLLEQYLSRFRTQDRGDLGARFFISFAAALRDAGELHLTLDLLDEALDSDPENVHALHAAAAIREKLGQYDGASVLLRKLLRSRSDPEAQLRLALCRARSGGKKRAQQLLEDLTGKDTPFWIRAVAYQEWSQLRMAAGDPDGALRIARKGHNALPSDESLAVLVAFLAGPRDSSAQSLISRLTSRATGTGLTPRDTYNLWPQGIEQNESPLDEEIERRMPLLVQALRERTEQSTN